MSKNVLITGAANGLGYELSLLFAENRYKVFAVDIDEDALERMERQFQKTDYPYQSFKVDLANNQQIEDFLNALHDPIDVLVNNAGFVRGGLFHQQTPKTIHQSFFVNSIAPIRLMQHFIAKNLRDKRDLQILNVVSVSAFLGFNGASVYGSTKWAMMGISEALYREYKDHKSARIRLSVAAPSYIATGMFEGARPPLLTRFLQPKPLAKDIFRAFQKGQFLIIRPRLLYIIPYLKTLLGFRVWNRVLDLLRMDEGMKNWTGRK